MFRSSIRASFAVSVFLLISSSALLAQPALTTPPGGDNQKASVSQNIGLVKVTIDYNSPDVHAPNGEDRTGKIWGTLVPYGAPDLEFGTCTECPWRAGANENTVFTVSHDVVIGGQKLPAGSYGLHMIPGESEWTLILSRNSTAWGSFFYDPADDALRVKATPKKSEYHEWLTFEFTDRKPTQATVALKWENLEVPWTITVPDSAELYLAVMRNELRSNKGFDPEAWTAAAQFALQNKLRLEEALGWAQYAVNGPFIGEANFDTLSTLAQLEEANGKSSEAKATMDRALALPDATAGQIHQHGRRLLAAGKKDEALRVFQLNAKKHGAAWPVNVGLARGHAAVGNAKEALKYARLAVAQAPDEGNRKNLQAMVEQLEAGKVVSQ